MDKLLCIYTIEYCTAIKIIDIHNNSGKSQKHYVEQKPDTKDNILYDSLCMKFKIKQR